MSETLLIIWGSLSLIVSPLMFFYSLESIWGIFGEKAWWWKNKGCIGYKALDICFFIIPLMIGLHWLIIAIWFPNFYK